MKIFHPNISFTSLSVWKHKISAPHVKFSGNFKGMLICATNQDFSGAIFFLAHALVSKEEEVNWLYFVRLFRNTEVANSIVFFMSDRDKGLIDAARKVFLTYIIPNACITCQTTLKRSLTNKILIVEKTWQDTTTLYNTKCSLTS